MRSHALENFSPGRSTRRQVRLIFKTRVGLKRRQEILRGLADFYPGAKLHAGAVEFSALINDSKPVWIFMLCRDFKNITNWNPDENNQTSGRKTR